MDLTGGRGVDIVYDPVNGPTFEESSRCLAWGGRILILGFLGGGPTNIRSNYLLIKGIDAIGVRIGGLNEADPALAIANMTALTELAAQGKLKPRISHRFPLERAAEAVQAVIDRAPGAEGHRQVAGVEVGRVRVRCRGGGVEDRRRMQRRDEVRRAAARCSRTRSVRRCLASA